MDLGVGGRGYLLTGASRELGFATACALVDDDARVLISPRSAEGVSSAVRTGVMLPVDGGALRSR